MSSQGTGAADTDAFTFMMILDNWGAWARSDSLGGSMRKGVLSEAAMLGGLGWLYTDNEMCTIDRIIATLPDPLKRSLKHVHLHRRHLQDDGVPTYQNALTAFSDRLWASEGAGNIEVLFLDRDGAKKS